METEENLDGVKPKIAIKISKPNKESKPMRDPPRILQRNLPAFSMRYSLLHKNDVGFRRKRTIYKRGSILEELAMIESGEETFSVNLQCKNREKA